MTKMEGNQNGRRPKWTTTKMEVQSAPKRHEEVKNEADKDEPIIKVQSATKRKSKHRAKIFSCNQCEYKAATKSHLKAHERSKHKCFKYS